MGEQGNRLAQAQHHSDAKDLFDRLDSNASERVIEAKATFHDLLRSNRDGWLMYGLVEYYFTTGSRNCLDVICGAPEPHHKHLFGKIAECMRLPQSRHIALDLLGHIVRRAPSWLHHITDSPQSSVMEELYKILSCQEEHNIHNIMSATLTLVTLLPVIPAKMANCLSKLFVIFSHIAHFVTYPKQEMTREPCPLIFLNYALYLLFQRLYGMYPCNFLSYLRSHYSQASTVPVFTQTVKPFIDRAKLHPLLVTAARDAEVNQNRWKSMEAHDIVVECAKVFMDDPDGAVREDSFLEYCEERGLTFDLPDNKREDCLSLSSLLNWSPSRALLDSPFSGASGGDFIPRGSISVPQTPLPEGNGVCLIPPVSAPVTPRALESPPPEPAIEATPENTPVSTPNKELERIAMKPDPRKPKPTVIAKLGFRKPENSLASSFSSVSSSSQCPSSPEVTRPSRFLNDRLAKVASERAVPLKEPEKYSRVTSPVKFAEPRSVGGVSLPKPVAKRPSVAEIKLPESASDEDVEVSSIIGEKKQRRPSGWKQSYSHQSSSDSNKSGPETSGYKPLAHSSSGTSMSSQNSRCDSVIHDSTEEGASATLMDMETSGVEALFKHPLPVKPGGRRSSNSTSVWMDIARNFERIRFQSLNEPSRPVKILAGSKWKDDDGKETEEEMPPFRVRRRRKSNPDTGREKKSIKRDPDMMSKRRASDGAVGLLPITNGGTLKRRRRKKSSTATVIAMEDDGSDGDGEEEEDVSCATTVAEEVSAKRGTNVRRDSETGALVCSKRHSSGTQTEVYPYCDISPSDMAVSQFFKLGLLYCPNCGSEAPSGACSTDETREHRAVSYAESSSTKMLDAYLGNTPAIPMRQRHQSARPASPVMSTTVTSTTATVTKFTYQTHRESTPAEMLLSDKIAALENQARLTKILVAHEKYCRNVYAERSRRLWSRAKEAYFLNESKVALQDQLALAERAAAQLCLEKTALERQLAEAQNRERALLVKCEGDVAKASSKAKKLLQEVDQMKQNLAIANESRTRAERDLATAKRELWCSQQEVEQLKKKADKCVELTNRVQFLEKELSKQSLVTENVRAQLDASAASRHLTRPLSRRPSGKAGAADIIRSSSFISRSAQHEMKQLKVQCDDKIVALEAARAKVSVLEARLVSKDLQLTEQKRILKAREEEYNLKAKSIEEKYSCVKSTNEALELELLRSRSRSETLSRQLQTSLRRKAASTDNLEGAEAISIPSSSRYQRTLSSSSPNQHSSSWSSSVGGENNYRASATALATTMVMNMPLSPTTGPLNFGNRADDDGGYVLGLPSISENQFRPSLSPGPGGLHDLEQTLAASSPPTAAF